MRRHSWIASLVIVLLVLGVLGAQKAPRIERASKQPTAKANVLSRTFPGWQDRNTVWTLTFLSETNKPLAYSEDPTEYGSVVIEGKREEINTEYTSQTRSISRRRHGTPARPLTRRRHDECRALGQIRYPSAPKFLH